MDKKSRNLNIITSAIVKIIGLAQSDLIMRVRMANEGDLVASEGKYHLKCWVLFQRKIGKLN